jgi:GNAT superfamily N-acetyltransferase
MATPTRFATLRLLPNGTESPRLASGADAGVAAELLDRFNREFDVPSSGPAVLTARLERLLTGRDVVALLAGTPAVGIALLTPRPNAWYEGPVALLDEPYVIPAERGRGIGTALLKAAEEMCTGQSSDANRSTTFPSGS